MEFVRGLQGLKAKHRGAVITIGSFDGIHLGHGALIASTCGLAKQLAQPAMMLTFEPLPREYLASHDPPARLTDFRERWRVLDLRRLVDIGRGATRLPLRVRCLRCRGWDKCRYVRRCRSTETRMAGQCLVCVDVSALLT